MNPKDTVVLTHPDIPDSEFRVTYAAYKSVWGLKGWHPVGSEPEETLSWEAPPEDSPEESEGLYAAEGEA